MRGIKQLFGQVSRRGFFGLVALITLASQLTFVLPVHAESVTLSGQITDSSNSQPIANASIKLLLGTNVIGERTSDASGAYVFSSETPIPISFTVSVSAIGYQTNSSNTVNLSQSVTLDVALDPGLGRVSGQIIGADDNSPISGATIRILKGDVMHATAQTDTNGFYATSPLNSPDNYQLQVFPPTGSPYQIVTENINISGDITRDKVLPTGTVTLSGTIKTFDDGIGFDPTHPYNHQLPIENATVQLLDVNTETVIATASSDVSGSYSLTFTPQNFYDVRVLPPTGTPLGGGSEQSIWRNRLILSNTVHNFDLNHENPKISGKVVDSNTGQPIPGANIQLYWSVVNGVNPMTGTTATGDFSLWSTRATDLEGDYTFGIPGDFPIYQNKTYFIRVTVEGEEPVDSGVITPTEDTVLADIAVNVTPADSSPPTIFPEYSSNPNENGWHNTPVTLSWLVVDQESAITNQTGCDPTIHNTDTPSIDYICTATSGGGTASQTTTIKYDATAPVLNSPTWAVNPQAIGSDTTVTVSVADATSGVGSGEYFMGLDPGQGNGTPMDLTNDELTANLGASLPIGEHTISIRARDNAGNWSTITTTTLTIEDWTAPEITPNLTLPNPDGENGWYKTPVTLSWTVTDPESAITNQIGCDPVAVNVDTDADGTDYICSATSAGGISSETVTIKYDATAPLLDAQAWSANPKATNQISTLTVPASDETSGVAGGEYFIGEDPGQGNGATMNWDGTNLSTTFGTDFPVGVYKISVRAVDNAGNWSDPKSSQLVVYDPEGVFVTGSGRFIPGGPTSDPGDTLPNLDGTTKAKVEFHIVEKADGSVDGLSTFRYGACTEGQCIRINSTSVDTLSFNATGRVARIKGKARIMIDGEWQADKYKYVIRARDGDLGGSQPDHYLIQVYELGANPGTSEPIYQASGDMLGDGAITIYR